MKHIRFHARTAMLLLVVLLTTATAWAQQTVYQDGNVSIVQNSGGWQILIGKTVVGHGDGTLDVNNLPPAFQDMLDFYATQKEPAAKKNRGLSKAAPDNHIYGPLLTTTWNQREPYNLLCPKITIQEQSSGITKELLTLTGCSTTSSAQILNYYGYCDPFSVNSNDDPDNFKRTVNEQNMVKPYISSQYVSDVTLEENGEVSYKVHFPEYTPDFSKMDYDNNELAMLNVGVAFAQKPMLGTTGTGTYPDYQRDAFNEYFGYTADLILYEGDNAGKLDGFNNLIANSIKQARPILIDGSNSNGGHSYIIDGYDENLEEYHFNYGWSGASDGWFSTTLYPTGIAVITTEPKIKGLAHMSTQKVVNVVIRNTENNEETTLAESNGMDEFKTTMPFEAGEYEFYFVYDDNSKIAPYTAGKTITLSNNNLTYRRRGTFVSSPAKLNLDGTYYITFKHDLQHGEISLHAEIPSFTISGTALDDNNNPVKGVVISTAQTIPTEKILASETNKNGWSPLGSVDIPFLADNKYLSGVNIPLTIPYDGNRGGDVTISILDHNKESLWGTTIQSGDFDANTIIRPDALVGLTAGNQFYVRVASTTTDNGGMWGYEWNNGNPMFTVYGYDDFFVTTDDQGEYSYPVLLDWSGTLNALSTEKIFNSLTFDNVQSDQPQQDFIQKGLYRVTIFGTVYDGHGKPVKGAVITAKENISEESSCKLEAIDGVEGGYTVLGSSTSPLKPTTEYLTKLKIKVYVYSDNPKKLRVAITKGETSVWQAEYSSSEYQKIDGIIVLDKPLKVVKGDPYQLTVTADNDGGLWTYEYNKVFDDNGKEIGTNVRYECWGTDDYYATSDADGKYTYYADNADWSGTLNAFTPASKFNTLTFENVTTNQTDQNFYSLTKFISGKVLDNDGNPIKWATITESDSKPEPVQLCGNNTCASGRLSETKEHDFKPTKPYLTGFTLDVWIDAGHPGKLTYAILDEDRNVVLSKELPEARYGKEMTTYFEKPIVVIPGKKYYLQVSPENSTDEDHYNYAYDCDWSLFYKIYGVDCMSDENGEYTYAVTSPYKGSLNAISGNLKFNTLSFNGITESQTDQDFNCITKYISGKVLDKYNTPIAGAIITDNDKMPEPEIISQNVEPSTGSGTAVYIANHEVTINPTVNYLTKIFVESFIQDNPQGDYTVEILDKSRISIWSKTMDENTFSTSVTPENPIHVTPGEPYYLKISVANTSGTWAINMYGGKMRYKVWGVSYEKTNFDGEYTYPVTTPWSGTLHAFSDDKKFNTLTFSGVSSNLTDKDFKENTQNIEYYSVTYKVDGEIYQTVGELQEGDDIPSLAEVPTKNGYVFKGWNPALPTTMPKGNLEVEAQWCKSLDNSDITVADIPSKTYDATAYTPSITVMDNGEALTGSDYEVSIPSNCIDAGEYTVTITGKGDNYAGEIKKTFSITRANLIVRADGNYKMYGDPDPKLTATIDGLFDGANIEYTVYRAEGEKVGDYAINVTGDAVQWNYNITYQSGQFAIINKKTLYDALIITENEKGKTAVLNADYNETTETMEITEDIQDISTLTYTRKFTKDATATVMLPFDFDVKDFKGTFRTLQSVAYDEEKKRWEATPSDAIEPEKGKLKANTPYIFIPTADCGPFTFSDVTIIKPDFNNDNEITASTEAEKWELVGVYHYKVWSERMATEYGFAAIAGKGFDQDGNYMGNIEIGEFVRAGENSKIKPTRCFLRYSGSGELAQSKSTTELPDRIVLVLPDETASVIDPDDPSNNLDDNGDIKTPTSEINHNTIDAKVWAYDKTIYIEAQPNVAYSVIGLNGSVLINGITAADREEVRLPVKHDGVVIVVVGGKSFKIKY